MNFGMKATSAVIDVKADDGGSRRYKVGVNPFGGGLAGPVAGARDQGS